MRPHLVNRDRPAELACDRREGSVLEPAGRDPLRERGEIEVDVQGVPVRRHPLRDMDPDARDLARRRLDPDPGQAFDPRRVDPEWRERPDQRLLEVAAVALHVLPVPRQVEDRIADELSWPVVGRLAAAIGLDDLDLLALGHVQLVFLGAPAERDHRRVLEQDDRVRQLAGRDGARERALQLPRLAVGDEPEVDDVPGSAHARSVAACAAARHASPATVIARSVVPAAENPEAATSHTMPASAATAFPAASAPNGIRPIQMTAPRTTSAMPTTTSTAGPTGRGKSEPSSTPAAAQTTSTRPSTASNSASTFVSTLGAPQRDRSTLEVAKDLEPGGDRIAMLRHHRG